jgi:hypothetical protein
VVLVTEATGDKCKSLLPGETMNLGKHGFPISLAISIPSVSENKINEILTGRSSLPPLQHPCPELV